jgi:hypothetical protein
MDESAKRDWELMELLGAAWDDCLDESSRNRLEQLLSVDGGAGVRLLTEFTRMHVDLEWLISSQAAHQKAMGAIARAKTRQAPSQVRRLPSKGVMGLAAAALLVLVAAWQLTTWRGNSRDGLLRGDSQAARNLRPPMPVGRIVGQDGVRWEDGRQLQHGQTLVEGQVIDLAVGTARISMDAGAELVLKSPCRATLISGDMVTLQNGLIAVKVAEWGVGFKVSTNDLLVTDFGTRFMVQADAQAGSEVHVLEGRVIASALKQPVSQRRVGAGQAVRANADGTLGAALFRRETFVDVLDSAKPLRPIKIANTGVGVQVGDSDQHWRITAGDPQLGPYPQRAQICLARSNYGANDPGRSQWISVTEGTTRGVPVRTKYVFETTFDLSGFDPNTVRLTGLVLADNGVEEIRLNGKQLPIAPWLDWTPEVTFYAFHTIEITGGFVPGKNKLSFVVMNETDLPSPEEDAAPPEAPNPMALRVEWQGSGRPR